MSKRSTMDILKTLKPKSRAEIYKGVEERFQQNRSKGIASDLSYEEAQLPRQPEGKGIVFHNAGRKKAFG